MLLLHDLVHRLIELRQSGQKQITLLAVSPNSDAVLEAAVKCAALNNFPMLFAATLNQVDRDGGYTAQTPAVFMARMRAFAEKYAWDGPLYVCLAHGGPWLKERHALDRLLLEGTLREVKLSLTACLQAGYSLLHIDPSLDRSLPPDQTLPVDVAAARTLDLIVYAESERARLNLPALDYEVGSGEVRAGLSDPNRLIPYLVLLRAGLAERGLSAVWPCFIAAPGGAQLHPPLLDAQTAASLVQLTVPLGSLPWGHAADWVENPAAYPLLGMGAATIGPQLTAAEVDALRHLCETEEELHHTHTGLEPSSFMRVLEQAVAAAGCWRRQLLPNERGRGFARLSRARRTWLVRTGAWAVWNEPGVVEARAKLYRNLHSVEADPHSFVIDHIVSQIDQYVEAFNLLDALSLLA